MAYRFSASDTDPCPIAAFEQRRKCSTKPSNPVQASKRRCDSTLEQRRLNAIADGSLSPITNSYFLRLQLLIQLFSKSLLLIGGV